jgi:hypothetical protein
MVAVIGGWALAAGAVIGAGMAAADLYERVRDGNMSAAPVILDIAQIAASITGLCAARFGKLVIAAPTAAVEGAPPRQGRADQLLHRPVPARKYSVADPRSHAATGIRSGRRREAGAGAWPDLRVSDPEVRRFLPISGSRISSTPNPPCVRNSRLIFRSSKCWSRSLPSAMSRAPAMASRSIITRKRREAARRYVACPTPPLDERAFSSRLVADI